MKINMSVYRKIVSGIWLALLTSGHFIIISIRITLKIAFIQIYRFMYIHQKNPLSLSFSLFQSFILFREREHKQERGAEGERRRAQVHDPGIMT